MFKKGLETWYKEPNEATRFIKKYAEKNLDRFSQKKILKIKEKAESILDEIKKYTEDETLDPESQQTMDNYFVQIQKIQEDFFSKLNKINEREDKSEELSEKKEFKKGEKIPVIRSDGSISMAEIIKIDDEKEEIVVNFFVNDKLCEKTIDFNHAKDSREKTDNFQNLIQEASSLDDIIQIVEKIGNLNYSDGSIVSPEKFKNIINTLSDDILRIGSVGEKYNGFKQITRSFGLRDKVKDLFRQSGLLNNNENIEKTESENGIKSESSELKIDNMNIKSFKKLFKGVKNDDVINFLNNYEKSSEVNRKGVIKALWDVYNNMKSLEDQNKFISAIELLRNKDVEKGEENKKNKFQKKRLKEKIKLDDLDQKIESLGNQIEDFNDLSEGQKSLVMYNFKQLLLSNIKENAHKDFKQDMAQSNLLKKVWKGALKEYKIAELEKSTAREVFDLKFNDYLPILQKLAEGMKKYGPAVKLGEQGEIEIQYIDTWGLSGLTPAENEIIDDFNKIATQYGNMPYEWSLDSATPKQQAKFKEIKEKFDFQKDLLASIFSWSYINDMELKIKLNQFFNSNPEVEKELSNIKDKGIWKKVAKTLFTEKGIYMGSGFVLRSATTAIIGAVALPFAAAGIGAWRSNIRAKNNLKEQDINARYGQKDSSKQARNIVDLGTRQVNYQGHNIPDKNKEREIIEVSTERKGLIGKIDNLIKKIESEKDQNKEQELKIKLKARLKYTEDKIENGLINFGNEENRLNNQYALIQKIGEARAFSQINDIDESGETYLNKLSRRLEEYLNFKDRKISKERKKLIIKKTITGGLISAGFATAGYYIRHLIEKDGLLSGVKDNLKRSLKEYLAEENPSVPTTSNTIGGVSANSDSLENIAPDSLQTPASADSTMINNSGLEEDLGVISDSSGSTTELTNNVELEQFEISDCIRENKEVDIEAVLALKDRGENDLEDVLAGAEKVAVIKKGEGVSQALGEFQDSDMTATVINPDGTQIQGDIHLAHVGDTVIQKDGEIYILKTSEVKVSENDSLAKAWLKAIENKIGNKLTDEEIKAFDLDQDGEVEWDEARAAYDGLNSKDPKVIKADKLELEKKSLLEDLRRQREVVKDLENNINEYRILNDPDYFSQEDEDIKNLLDNYQKENAELTKMEYKLKEFDNSEQTIPKKSNVQELDQSIKDNKVKKRNITPFKLNKEESVESMNTDRGDTPELAEQFFNNENGRAMMQLNNANRGDLVTLNKPLDKSPLIGVNRFRFTGEEDSRGKYFEYFQVGKDEPSKQVIFEITESSDGGVGNIKIKGFKNIK